jgi:hypothetical protein
MHKKKTYKQRKIKRKRQPFFKKDLWQKQELRYICSAVKASTRV